MGIWGSRGRQHAEVHWYQSSDTSRAGHLPCIVVPPQGGKCEWVELPGPGLWGLTLSLEGVGAEQSPSTLVGVDTEAGPGQHLPKPVPAWTCTGYSPLPVPTLQGLPSTPACHLRNQALEPGPTVPAQCPALHTPCVGEPAVALPTKHMGGDQ